MFAPLIKINQNETFVNKRFLCEKAPHQAKRLKLDDQIIDVENVCTGSFNSSASKEFKSPVDRSHPIVNFKHDLRTVLTQSNHNIKKWLNLQCIPHCLMNFEKCVAQHGRQAERFYNDRNLNSMLLVYIQNEDYTNFSRYLQFCITDKLKIPSEAVFSEIFQLVLDIQDSQDDTTATCFVLETVEHCFSSLLALHPPHAYYMKRYYKTLLTMSIPNCKHTDRSRFESYSGIFLYCLNLLEAELTGLRPEGPINSESSQSRMESKFRFAKNTCSINHNYDSLTRKQRMCRLFILLKMFVNIFEQDLAFRIMIYNKEKSSARKLIISHIIWQKTDALNIGCMRPCIRKIINLLVTAVRTKRNKMECKVLARLLGTVVHAVHLSTENRKKIFLNISTGVNALAIDIAVTLQSQDTTTVIGVLRLLQPCFIKHLVSNNILNAILRVSNNSAVKTLSLNYQEVFIKQLWNQFPNIRFKNNNENEFDTNEITVPLKQLICVKDCIAILNEALLAFIETYELKALNKYNVLEIERYFEQTQIENDNKLNDIDNASKSTESSLADLMENELLRFRNIFEQHFDFPVPCEPLIDVKKQDYFARFEAIMMAKQTSQNSDWIKTYSYIPVVSWVTGRNYYKKCVLYLDVIKQVKELKDVKQSKLFKNFKL